MKEKIEEALKQLMAQGVAKTESVMELCYILQCSRSALFKWLNGDRRPKESALFLLRLWEALPEKKRRQLWAEAGAKKNPSS